MIAALLLAAAQPGATPDASLAYTQLRDPAQEAAARGLMEEIRCLVCQGQSVADSDADIAGEMRALIRGRIRAGESPRSVRDWLVDRYGAYVTYDPPLSAATLPLWLAPLVLVGIGLLVARGSFRRR